MPQARSALALGVSLAAHAGLLAILAWLLDDETRREGNSAESVVRVIPFDLPPLSLRAPAPLEPAQTEDASTPAEHKPIPTIKWPRGSDTEIAAIRGVLTRLNCWPADEDGDIEECLDRLMRDPALDQERRLMIRAGVDQQNLIAIAIGRGWMASPRGPIADRQRLLAATTDTSYRNDYFERRDPSPIPEDPYAR